MRFVLLSAHCHCFGLRHTHLAGCLLNCSLRLPAKLFWYVMYGTAHLIQILVTYYKLDFNIDNCVS